MSGGSHPNRAHQEADDAHSGWSVEAASTNALPLPDGRGSELPYLTADLPGTGGTLKREPEDFVVEEIPAYEPAGEGEHLFVWIEKRDVAADDLVRHIADALGISRDDVGTAGLKDRRAVTRQYVSVPAVCEPKVAAIETESIRVLRAARHGNKLRTGHLRGNRFEIVLRDIVPRAADRSRTDPREGEAPAEPRWEGEAPAEPDRRADVEHSSGSAGASPSRTQNVQQIAAVIREKGFPNYYGAQRFGSGGQTLALGLDLLTGRKKPRDIPHRQRKFLLRLALSSVQAALFNEVLARRLRDGLLRIIQVGDVMQKRETGGLFVVEDDRQECLSHEQQRFESGETVMTGPMFGPKMRRPTGPAAEREAAVLREFGLTSDQFAQWKRLLPGTRRPLLAFASGLAIEQTGDSIRLSFTLDRGVYATTLLREFMKPPASQTSIDDPPSGD